MLILRHNTLSSEELFTIERKMLKIADQNYEVNNLQHFNILNKSRAELYGYILGFSERMGLCNSIGVTPSEFLDFLVDVDQGYLPNAYHSFYHAVDVALALYQMVYQYDVESYLSRIDLAALFIAGLCHDIGHPGKNNNYQVNLKTELAKNYSNKSALESYSCTLTMDLLSKHRLLRHLEQTSASFGLRTTEPEMKTAIIKMILATDMIFHYELQENSANLLELIVDYEEENYKKHKPSLPPTAEEIEDEPEMRDIFSSQGTESAIDYFRKKSYFEDSIPLYLKNMSQLSASPERVEGVDYLGMNHVAKNMNNTPSSYIMEPQQRLILCQIVLHAADISNALRPWPICKRWSDLVCEEFFCQGEAEQANGLPISPNMDRNQVSQTTIGLQFGDFVVSPYFEVFAALFPKAVELLNTLAENRIEWLKMEQALATYEEGIKKESETLPTDMLPDDRPIINPTGRRVSVAAGMIVIPDELEERTVGSGKNKRKYWSVRSVSHSEALDTQKIPEAVCRRKSEEPMRKIKTTIVPIRKPTKKSFSVNSQRLN
ncbi:hypothetical protein G6F60_005388 [Rhizopus arrhizus]|uniref:Phosphodiesterase n=1 Tax=Rhizopus oryzae TaxID=64495 RepID=A0A9P6XKM6_RHIOR|nr:hypothetical protein G6F64_000587 [Rhizopus arrhizus]KAG1402909.1 hypothetical protein G6F60_005388 [Rhizopus arrhizus]